MIYLKWILFIYIFLMIFFKLSYCAAVAKFRKLKTQLLKFQSQNFF